jgi:tRNA-2-methylthio-N6-dimethylallyladenosine synthase
MVGTIQSVLVEGFSKKSDRMMSGRTENNRVVNFDGPAAHMNKDLIGTFAKIRITEALRNSLRGVLEV